MHRRPLAWLVVGGVVGCVALGAAYDHEPLRSLDHGVADWVAAELPRWLEWAARPFSWLGGWIGLTALGMAAAALLARERAWLDLSFFLVAFVGSQLAVSLLKEAVARPRPDTGSAVPLPESYAFPSGHAAAGAACLGALAVLAAERLEGRRWRAALWVGVAILGLGVGLSRVALNVHFVTDVLGGFGFGIAWLAACLLARDALATRGRRPSRR